MKNLLKEVHKGFTLIELLIVIIIIGTLVSIGVYFYSPVIAQAKAVKIVENMHAVRSAVTYFYLDNFKDSKTLEVNDFRNNLDVLHTYLGKFGNVVRSAATAESEYVVVLDNTKYGVLAGNKNRDGNSEIPDPKQWFIKCDFSQDPDREALITQLASLASKAQILNDRYVDLDSPRIYKKIDENGNEMKDENGNVITYEWRGLQLYDGINYSRGPKGNTDKYKYVVYMRALDLR